MTNNWLRLLRGRAKLLLNAVFAVGIIFQFGVAGELYFEQVSVRESGLDFQFVDGSRGRFDLPEIMGGGVAAADFDGDGRIDLFFSQGGPIGDQDAHKTDSPCQWYQNLGGLKFRKMETNVPGPSYAMGAWPADFDADGRIDLFVTGWQGWSFYRNLGGWRFEDVTARLGNEVPAWSTAAVWADLNGDSHLDLFVGGYLNYDAGKAPFCAAPDGRRDYCGPEDFQHVADRVYFGDGRGYFENVTFKTGMIDKFGRALGAIAFDVNEDRRLDLFVANDGSANQLWVQGADGRFRDEAVERGVALAGNGETLAGMGVAAGDFTGHGRLDLLVTNFYDRGTVFYRNQGDGLFEDRSVENRIFSLTRKFNGFGVLADDFNNDGRLEIVQANGHVLSRERLGVPLKMSPLMLSLDEKERFEMVSQMQFPAGQESMLGRGLIAADFDADGRCDLLITRLDGQPLLLKNTSKGKTGVKPLKRRYSGGSYLSGVVPER